MKVTARMKDGTTIEIPIPDEDFLLKAPTPYQAIEYAKTKLAESTRKEVKMYEVEEDFL